MTEEQYIKGFDNGYLLAENEPKLISSITQNMSPSTQYLEGLIDGKEQLANDKSRQEMNELQTLREKSQGKSNDLEIE